jgi:hypothetical protein
MSAAKHTPGPWMAKPHGVIVGGKMRRYVNGSAQSQIGMACVVNSEEGDTVAERDANALMFAASLDMLGALRHAVKLLRTHVEPVDLGGERFDMTDCKEMAPIFDAIAKATGSAS